MTTHTPGPWRIGQQGFDNGGFPETVIVADAAGGKVVAPCVCLHFEHYPEMREANAGFIVRACNAHYDLLAACEALVSWADGDTAEVTDGNPLDDAIESAMFAIAKAKGGAK